VKLYKNANAVLGKDDSGLIDENQIIPASNGPDQNQENVGLIAQNQVDKKEEKRQSLSQQLKLPEESKVGKKLSDLTTRRVIILVLAMIFSVPLFSTSTYMEEPTSFQYGLNMV
jgi:hypothetical protein